MSRSGIYSHHSIPIPHNLRSRNRSPTRARMTTRRPSPTSYSDYLSSGAPWNNSADDEDILSQDLVPSSHSRRSPPPPMGRLSSTRPQRLPSPVQSPLSPRTAPSSPHTMPQRRRNRSTSLHAPSLPLSFDSNSDIEVPRRRASPGSHGMIRRSSSSVSPSRNRIRRAATGSAYSLSSSTTNTRRVMSTRPDHQLYHHSNTTSHRRTSSMSSSPPSRSRRLSINTSRDPSHYSFATRPPPPTIHHCRSSSESLVDALDELPEFLHSSCSSRSSSPSSRSPSPFTSNSSLNFYFPLKLKEEKRSRNPFKRLIRALKANLTPSQNTPKPRNKRRSSSVLASARRAVSSVTPSSFSTAPRRIYSPSTHSGDSAEKKYHRRHSIAEGSWEKRRAFLKRTNSASEDMRFVDELDFIDGKKPPIRINGRRISFDSIEMLAEKRMERERTRKRDELLDQLQKAKEERSGKTPSYLCQGNVVISRNSFDDAQRALQDSIEFMRKCKERSRKPLSPVIDAMGADVIVYHIFVFLDWYSLEKVGYTCKAMFHYSSANWLWKRLTRDVLKNRMRTFNRLNSEYERKKTTFLGFWKEKFFLYTPNYQLYNQQKHLINHSFYIHAKDGEYLTKEQCLKATDWLGLLVPEEAVDQILTPAGIIDFPLFSSFTWRYERDFPEDAVNIRCRRIFHRLCRSDCSVLFVQDVTNRAANDNRWNQEFLNAIIDYINETRQDALSPTSRYITYEEFCRFFIDEKQERFQNSSYVLM